MLNYFLCRNITNRQKCWTANFGVSRVSVKFIRNPFRSLVFNTCRHIQIYHVTFSLHALRKIATQYFAISKCNSLFLATITYDTETYPLSSHITLPRTEPKLQIHLLGRQFHEYSLYAFNRYIKYFTFHMRNFHSNTSNELFRNSCCPLAVLQNCTQAIESHRNNCVQCRVTNGLTHYTPTPR